MSKGRLWRKTDPRLSETDRRSAIKALMQARHAMQTATTEEDVLSAKVRVQDAKVRLGEAGPVWWSDAAPDESGRHPEESSYADWWSALPLEE